MSHAVCATTASFANCARPRRATKSGHCFRTRIKREEKRGGWRVEGGGKRLGAFPLLSTLRPPPEAMNGETLRQTVRITGASGLHLRPLTAFAQRAQQFQARIA